MAEKKMQLLHIFMCVDKKGEISTFRLNLSQPSASLFTCNDVCNITKSAIQKVSFKKPSDFGLAYTYFLSGFGEKMF